jgi:hypothetical protein
MVAAVSYQKSHLTLERIGHDVAGIGGGERSIHRGRSIRLHCYHPDPAPEPGCNASDKRAAADRHQQRVDVGNLSFEL